MAAVSGATTGAGPEDDGRHPAVMDVTKASVVNAHGAQKDVAWDFLKWFGSPAVHKQFVMAGGPPSRLSAMQDPDVVAKYPWTEQLFEAQKNAWVEVRPRHPLAFQMIDTVGADVNKAIIGEATPQAAMDNAQEQVTKLLKQNGLLQ